MKQFKVTQSNVNRNDFQRIKVFFGVGLAVTLTILLFYVVYSLKNNKDTFLSRSFQRSENIDAPSIVLLPGKDALVTGSQLEILEKDILNNVKLQKLKNNAKKIPVSITSGNNNPFKPFNSLEVDIPKKIETEFTSISKPVRVNKTE